MKRLLSNSKKKAKKITARVKEMYSNVISKIKSQNSIKTLVDTVTLWVFKNKGLVLIIAKIILGLVIGIIMGMGLIILIIVIGIVMTMIIGFILALLGYTIALFVLILYYLLMFSQFVLTFFVDIWKVFISHPLLFVFIIGSLSFISLLTLDHYNITLYDIINTMKSSKLINNLKRKLGKRNKKF